MRRAIVIVTLSFLIISFVPPGIEGVEWVSPFPSITTSYNQQNREDSLDLIKVDSFNLKILPPSSGVQFYRDGIVFLSRSQNESKMVTNHISFGTIEAYFAIPGDTVPEKKTIFSQTPSFSYPCEGVTFSNDYQSMYFSKITNKDLKERIYFAKYSSQTQRRSGWVSQKMPLDFCTGNSTYTHPALSNEENFLIFATDRDGTKGGMDLFISRKEEDKWSEPENLGESINTSKNEFFPFLDADNNLYFSSDGLPGYGGYDIFSCKFNGETWDTPVNLSDRINTADDDIAFTINRMDGKTAFYTNRKLYDKDAMQLFKVTLDHKVPGGNLLTISNIFNGKAVTKPVLTVEKPLAEAPDMKKDTAILPSLKIDKTEEKTKETEIVEPLPEPVISEKPTEPVIEKITPKEDVVVYRVQFLSATNSKGKFSITIESKNYDVYEYFYMGAFRYTIGEFSTLAPAAALQRICRKSGYPEAFVTAFVNNERSLDKALFK